MNDLVRLFRRAIYNTIDNRGRPGLLGRADGTITFTDDSGVNHREKVWVRIIIQASTTEVVAENRGVPHLVGLPVRVAEVNGVVTVIGVDTRAANIVTGGYLSEVPEHAWTHGRFGPDPLYITGPMFLPLMAVPTYPASYSVTIVEGWYRYGNVLKVWEQADTSTLSAYVPGTTGQQRGIVLSLNRATNTIVITDLGTKQTPYTTGAPFTNAEILAVIGSLGLDHYPIAAIRFYFGQTAIYPHDIFKDLRLWGGEVLVQYYDGAIVSDNIEVSDSVSILTDTGGASVSDDAVVSDSASLVVSALSINVSDDLTVRSALYFYEDYVEVSDDDTVSVS